MANDTARSRFDVAVVGARCAGAATALLLARAGARVIVVDHDEPGTDTMSTHALMRGGVLQLARWGVLDAVLAAGTPIVTRTEFHYGADRVAVDIRPAFGTEGLCAPRRTVLDLALVRAAAAAGAEFRFGTSCDGLLRRDDGRVSGLRLRGPGGRVETVSAGIVIGADGRRSAVARHAGAEVRAVGLHAGACVYAYCPGLPNRGYRWYYAPGAAGGIIPTNDDLSCVFLALPRGAFDVSLRGRGRDAVARAIDGLLPAMSEELGGFDPETGLITFRGEPGFVRQSVGPGWALVGDAGYFKDPITAHGITDALRDAEILAAAVLAGRPEDYPPTRDALSAGFARLTDEIASYGWTLDELKAKHLALNVEMKREQAWIVEALPGFPQAA